jgi:hypothetical protein
VHRFLIRRKKNELWGWQFDSPTKLQNGCSNWFEMDIWEHLLISNVK